MADEEQSSFLLALNFHEQIGDRRLYGDIER
jgi:hypothetical protein